jgi:hypothetical protein
MNEPDSVFLYLKVTPAELDALDQALFVADSEGMVRDEEAQRSVTRKVTKAQVDRE